MNRLICEAINKGRTLELRYHGYSRTAEPHAYGRAEDGNSLLQCFQTSGGSFMQGSKGALNSSMVWHGA
jgi:hypothetical protein